MRPVILVLSLQGPSAAVAEVPLVDVEGHCDAIAGFGDTYSNEMFSFCIESEQTAYDRLKPGWDAIPAGVRAPCEEIASFVPPGSYEMLAFCVEQELSAAGNRPTFRP